MIIGLAGAHRVGKTTLARAYAQKARIKLLKTSASESLAKVGFTARDAMTLSERLEAQEIILNDCVELWDSYEGDAITDRTPLDFAAYTVAEVTMAKAKELSVELDERLNDYVAKCMNIAKSHFGEIIVVQPGITIVDAAKSAAPSVAYMTHLNYIMTGMANANAYSVIPRTVLSLSERVSHVERVATLNVYTDSITGVASAK